MSKVFDMADEVNQQRLQHLFRYGQTGRCVSSVTHDVNNYLGAVMAYSELVAMDSSISEDAKRMLNETISAIKKASGLISHLTDIARKDRKDIRFVDAGDLCERAIDLLRYDIRKARIDLQITPGENLAPLAVDMQKALHALISILHNAIEAVENIKFRRINISVNMVDSGAEIVVLDSGEPIPDETRRHMFEPFFTTKEDGGHIGLGLTMARSVACLHEGDLVHDPDRGFVLTLAARSAYCRESD